MQTVLVILIVVAFGLVYRLLDQFFFEERAYGISSDSMRALALFFDLWILHVISTIVMVLMLGGRGELGSILRYMEEIINVSGYDKLRHDWLILEIKLLGVYTVYATIFESFTEKGTFGKRMVKIKFDKPVGVLRAIVRNVLKPISIVFWPVFMMVSRFSAERKWLHDRVSGTKIIQIEKR